MTTVYAQAKMLFIFTLGLKNNFEKIIILIIIINKSF